MARILIIISCVLAISGCSQKNYNSLRICLAGDVMLDRYVEKLAGQMGRECLFDEVKPVFDNCDFTIVNLECPLSDSTYITKKEMIFNANPDWLPVLKSSGITHLNLANNHSLDQGLSGFNSTIQNIEESNLIPIGHAESNSADLNPVILEKNGISVALFSANYVEQYKNYDFDGSFSPNNLTDDKLVTVIQNYKNQNSVIILVYLHWGYEYMEFCTQKQQELAHQLIDAGADVIVGHHPHVIQEYENYNGKPIYYSLGNLIFDQPFPQTHEGIILELELKKEKLSGIVVHHINTAGIVPFIEEIGN